MSCSILKRSLEREFENQHPAKCRRLNFLNRLGDIHSNTIYNIQKRQMSTCAADCGINMSPQNIDENIKEEIKNLHKYQKLDTTVENMQVSGESQDITWNIACLGMQKNPDRTFTLKDVELICKSLLQKKEEELHQKYHTLLITKLSEQYETFVKFTHDQIQQNYKNSIPTYLS